MYQLLIENIIKTIPSFTNYNNLIVCNKFISNNCLNKNLLIRIGKRNVFGITDKPYNYKEESSHTLLIEKVKKDIFQTRVFLNIMKYHSTLYTEIKCKNQAFTDFIKIHICSNDISMFFVSYHEVWIQDFKYIKYKKLSINKIIKNIVNFDLIKSTNRDFSGNPHFDQDKIDIDLLLK